MEFHSINRNNLETSDKFPKQDWFISFIEIVWFPEEACTFSDTLRSIKKIINFLSKRVSTASSSIGFRCLKPEYYLIKSW